MEKKPPHPATVVQRRAAHSATVALPKPAFGGAAERLPHPATVVQRRAPHPATAAQPAAGPRRPPHPASVGPSLTGGPSVQRRLWAHDYQRLNPKTASTELSKAGIEVDGNLLELLSSLEAEEVDYVLPQDTQAYATTLAAWQLAFVKQDRINVTKFLNVINSVLENGILTQKDREKLHPSQRPKTSTDDDKGSTNVHGILLDKEHNDVKEASVFAQEQSVNVLAEVRGDLLVEGTRNRIRKGILTPEERAWLVDHMKLNRCWGESFFKEIQSDLERHASSAQPEQVHLGSFFSETMLSYALNRTFDSTRGRNELNKRMLSAFLNIIDVSKIPKELWDAAPKTMGEGVLSGSIPARAIARMVLPKYMREYADRIVNPHGVEIVFKPITYPTRSDVHVYLPTGEKVTLKNDIDLLWREEVEDVMSKVGSVLTHMTRGF